ncbi:MAG: hypothetical protein GYB33_08925 [Gammaproteobacteria bacterium]|uniref:DUF6231 family protein n=1 Tax=Pseudomaricurvus alcaniphilus TaxID=1166482 RepID=UPI001408D722|nr:DUF6231 family protein [Pseudomaricurvus alcaniphilus]MBR9910456.1 hypothetical protein [Gammaproteobacteria bacterium]NHN36147.1 hypothetical protein [Pseudomaricurvus alcaniphilus]
MYNDKLAEIIPELIATIEGLQPDSLVYCTGDPVPALEALEQQGCRVARVHNIDELDDLPHFELGVVFDYLEQQPVEEGRHLLCRLRNLKCDKVWVAVLTCPEWNFNSMIGLGFKREHCYSSGDSELCSYSYDIASYNRKRDWNNPKFWANPENWGKYRW